jgi:hypothetical protein
MEVGAQQEFQLLIVYGYKLLKDKQQILLVITNGHKIRYYK